MASRLVALFATVFGDPTDEAEIEQRLREVAGRGELSVLQRLLLADDEASAARIEEYGGELLLTAVRREDELMAEYLLSLDAPIEDEHRRELLLSALAQSNVALVERLGRDGLSSVDLDVVGGCKPLVIMAVETVLALNEAERLAKMQSSGLLARLISPWEQKNAPPQSQKAEDVVACLLRHGADANTVGDNGDTALHIASRASSSSSLVAILLRIGAVPSLIMKNRDGLSPLHEAVRARNIEVVKLLLHAGADPALPTESGETALQLAIFSSTIYGYHVYELTRAMAAYGRAVWDYGCETRLAALVEEESSIYTRRRGSRWALPNSSAFAKSIRLCINQWAQDRLYGMPYTSVPIEVLRHGERATSTYIKTMKASDLEDVVHRRKVCVVGPSLWGKTSLVKSIVSSTPSLVHADEDRTIGIDLLGYAFADESRQGNTKYEVTFWDFAGQDIYQVAHTLFFSRLTLYLVCVDLKAYSDAMLEAQARPTMKDTETFMQRFVTRNILHWIRLIFVRQPDAEFVFVGTKHDCFENRGRKGALRSADHVWRDLSRRVEKWKHDLVVEIDEAIRNATDNCPTTGCSPVGSPFVRLRNQNDKNQLQDLRGRVHAVSSGKWIVVSAVNVEAVYDACEKLETTVACNPCGFAMPTIYSQVLKAIHLRRDEAATLHPRHRVERMIVPRNALCDALIQDIEGLTADVCEPILRTLHELGDILWYQQEAAGFLQDCIILDPTVVLDLVREVVNHNHTDENDTRSQDGRVTHCSLLKKPLWQQLDAELMLAFKSLLHYFQLAYPADNQPMDWDSDLIVPAYWKSIETASNDEDNGFFQSAKMRVFWEYELPLDMSEIVYENVAVLSHTPFAKRRVERRQFEAVDEKANVTTRVSLKSSESEHRDVLRVESGSTTGDFNAAWKCAQFYVMNIEYVLEAYPGLTASRYITAAGFGDTKCTRHRIKDLIKTYTDAMIMDKSDNDVRDLLSWLPRGGFTWYVEKAWRRPSMLSDIRVRDVVQDTKRKLDVLRKLMTADKGRRQYPALWTLEYSGALVTVEMLSDVSGVCFHEPIPIEVPDAFWLQCGPTIQRGLSIFSTVLPDAVSLGILNKIVRLASSHLDAKVEQAAHVHSAIDQLEISSSESRKVQPGTKWSARGAAALLRDLLILHDPAFSELKMPQISNLQCATTADGSYVWAHPDEIASLGEFLVPCDPVGDSVELAGGKHQQQTAGASADEAASPLPSELECAATAELQLRVLEIGGLANWDWRKLYCNWEIIRPGDPNTTLDCGSTPPQPSSTSAWAWSSLTFSITKITSVDMLRDCQLIVEVKRPSRCPGVVKSIGKGFVSLGACFTANENRPATIRVGLEEKGAQAKPMQLPRWVSCQITIAQPAESA